MKKIINGKIVNTDTQDAEIIGERVSARGYSSDPIGWEHIVMVDGVYYLETVGGNDIYSPEDDLCEIGAGCRDSLLPFVSGNDGWNRHETVIEHIESVLG